MNHRRLLLILLGLHLLLSLSFAVLTPLWQGHEPDYYNVVRFLATEHRLPTEADYPNGDAYTRQATQPPIYFLMAAPVVALMDNAEPVVYGLNPQTLCLGGENENTPAVSYISTPAYDQPLRGTIAAAYGLRLINVLLGALAVYLTYRAGLIFFSGNQIIALLGAAIFALEPNILHQLMLIGNDTLVLTISAAVLLLSAKILIQLKLAWREVILLIVLALAAPLIKLPGWVDLALALLVLAYKLIFTRRPQPLLLGAIGGIILLTVGIGWFNYHQYGSVLGRYRVLDSFVASLVQKVQLPPVVISAVFDATHGALLEALVLLQPRAAFVTIYNLMLLACLISVVVATIRALIKRDGATIKALGLLFVLTLMTVVMVLLRNTLIADASNTTAYNTATIFAPVRYYIPALPSLALLISAGLYGLLPRSIFRWLGALPAGAFALVAIGGVILLLITRPPNPVLSPSDYGSLPNVTPVSAQPATDTPQILGYQLQTYPASGQLHLTLYLSLNHSTEVNYKAQVDLLSGAQTVASCQFLPVNGLHPTPRWLPDQVITTQTTIPICAALPEDTTLAIRWLGYNRAAKLISTSDSVALTQLQRAATLARAKTCPPNLGVIDSSLQLLKWNSPPTVRAGDAYLPSVNWVVLNPLPSGTTRLYVFISDAIGTKYTCVGSPADANHPLSGWVQGEYIYYDTCDMRFRADAPPGDYTVQVELHDAAGNDLPVIDPSGAAGTSLIAGKVTFQP